VRAELGRPSVLLSGAGICPAYQRAELHDLEWFRATVDVNLTGSFHVARACAASLLEEGGAVLFVASATGLVASPRLAAYAAAKAGLVNLTRTLAREWASRGVRVNAICPGYVLTEMTAPVLEHEHLGPRVIDATPMARLGEIEEIVAPSLFLLSDEASYVTGAWLAVDGGLST
jgi:NAD(P)-dependent dehydrogenase (short-subunit alcohol dehydrogenase family)